MPKVVHIHSYKSAHFNALVTFDDLLQINENRVYTFTVRNRLCRTNYYLDEEPIAFSFDQQNPDRYVVVFPANEESGEQLCVIETFTGKCLRFIRLKSKTETFTHISLGKHLYFTISSDDSLVYFMKPEGNCSSSFRCRSNIKQLIAIPNRCEFAYVSQQNELTIISICSKKILKQIPLETQYSFIKCMNDQVIIGYTNGTIHYESITNSDKNVIETLNKSIPIGLVDNICVLENGIIYYVTNSKIIGHCFNAKEIYKCDVCIAIKTADEFKIYKVNQTPLCSSYDLQPPEPFTSESFYLKPATVFSSKKAVYKYEMFTKQISKISDFNNAVSIKKIASTNGCFGIQYISEQGNKMLSTYIADARKREDPCIDFIFKSSNELWVLQENHLVLFRRNLILIDEELRINLSDKHEFDQIFLIRDTIAVYSKKTGKALYLKDNQLIPFELVPKINFIRWPALILDNKTYLVKDTTSQFENLNHEDFIQLKVSITSCCWLGWTLFAVERRHVIAIGLNGQLRYLWRLPNSICVISAALPSKLVFVTSLPQLHVFEYMRPLLVFTLMDIDQASSSMLRMLSFLPAIEINPDRIEGLDIPVAMAVFNRMPPKKVTPFVMNVYSRYARFDELKLITLENGNDPEILKEIALRAKKCGQFEVARQIYTELNMKWELFELFAILQDSHNLAVLAEKTNLGSCIRYMGDFQKKSGCNCYCPVKNLELPPIKKYIRGLPFSLYYGDSKESTLIEPPLFDEINDFGLRKYFVQCDDEAEEETSETVSDLISDIPNDASEPAEEIVYKEKPKEDIQPEQQSDNELLDLFSDDEEPEKQKVQITFVNKVEPPKNTKPVPKFNFKRSDYSSPSIPRETLSFDPFNQPLSTNTSKESLFIHSNSVEVKNDANSNASMEANE